MVAEQWIKQIKKFFDMMEVTTEQKVQLAALMLKGAADCWWSLKKGVLTPPITWDVFVKAFNAEYFPDFIRQQKEMKFIELKQGNLPVAQYASQFIELGLIRAQHDDE